MSHELYIWWMCAKQFCWIWHISTKTLWEKEVNKIYLHFELENLPFSHHVVLFFISLKIVWNIANPYFWIWYLLARTGGSQGFPRAAAPMGVFSRVTTRISGSLSYGAREVRSPCAWRAPLFLPSRNSKEMRQNQIYISYYKLQYHRRKVD